MNASELIYITSQAMILVLLLSLPTVGVGALVGLLVGLFQGLTQIQDQTLSFAARLIATFVMMIFTARWLGIQLHRFTVDMFDRIATLG